MPESHMRDTATRKADVLAALEKQSQFWLATSDIGGRPHVIAVSAWWDGSDLVVTTTGGSRTARNMAMNPLEIGRASCRERVEDAVGAGRLKRKEPGETE